MLKYAVLSVVAFTLPLIPTAQANLGPPATSITAAGNRVCAIVMGHARCLGSELFGELGRGSQTLNAIGTPFMTASESAVTQGRAGPQMEFKELSAAARFTCGILIDGDVVCWGVNTEGQLGVDIPTGGGPDTPEKPWKRVDLGSGKKAEHVYTSGDFTCALLTDHSVKCWGFNESGQLGQGDTLSRGADGTMGDRLFPVALGTGRSATQLALGDRHACALLDNGTIKCWGFGEDGRLGNGSADPVGSKPGQMGDKLNSIDLGRNDAIAITAGVSHTCASFPDGNLKCWGQNNEGQLGLGDLADRGRKLEQMGEALQYVDLDFNSHPVSVKAGGVNTCVRYFAGNVSCWGPNYLGQLGIGNRDARGDRPNTLGETLTSVDLGYAAYVVDVKPTGDFSCALLKDARVKCWGNAPNVGRTRGVENDPMGNSLPEVVFQK